MRKFLLLTFMVFLGAISLAARADQSQKDAAYRQLFTSVFDQWDSNHDGVLDLKELNTAIENPAVRGSDAAIAVFLHRHLQVDKEGQNGLTLDEVQALAVNPQTQKSIFGNAWHIEAINHSLFAPDDPNLATFHQGGIGDCYLLAVIGAFVFQHPQMVRTMIQSQTNGGFQIQFGNGRNVDVGPLTDAELIMGASEGRSHGVWLSVLEKAYAQIDLENNERKTGATNDADEKVMTDFIGHGGYYAPVITLLTGHKASGVPLARWVKQDPQGGLERAHELIAKLAVQHKLMAANTGKTKPLPRGFAHGHVYGVLGYDPVARTVMVFNPWGNSFKPKGSSGLTYGYPTSHGIFQMPLDEFIQVFGGFTYETDRAAMVSRAAGR